MILSKHFPIALSFAALSTTLQIPITPLSTSTLQPQTSDALLSLHRSLIEISSISSNESTVGHWLATYLTSQNLEVHLQEVAPNRFNVYAHPPSNLYTKVLLSSHIDTVPPFWPYYYNKTDDTIHGRGSVDAKGSVAAQIIAALNAPESIRNELSFLFVVGEETGGDGMRFFSAHPHPSYETVIFGEPTEGKLVCGHKGILGFELKVQGKAAHSGYPWLGVSANEILIEALGKLVQLREKFPTSEKYGNTTLNFGKVEGGVAANVVAETAEAKLAARIAAGSAEDIKKLVEKALHDTQVEAQKSGGDLDIVWTSEGYGPVDIDCDVEGFEKLTVNYGTDIPNLEGKHRRFLYGPGSIFVAHSDHEALKREELEKAVEDYGKLIEVAVKGE